MRFAGVFKKICAAAVAGVMAVVSIGLICDMLPLGNGLVMNVEAATIAESGQCGDDVYYELDTWGTLTISGNGHMWSSNLPFSGLSGICNIIIENGVTSISRNVFSYCSGLKNVIISDSVTSIGTYAFYGCTNLTRITIPSSVTTIGMSAFGGCPDFTIYCEADSYSEMWAQENNINSNTSGVIDSGKCGDTVNYVLDSAGMLIISETGQMYDFSTYTQHSPFYQPSALTELIINVIVKDGVTTIGNESFYGCSSLKNIQIPSSVKSIGESAFKYCSSLESINIPDYVTSIGNESFWGCSSLRIDCNTGSYAEMYAKKNNIPYTCIVESGKCGENVTYTLNNEGILTILGTGKMYDYTLEDVYDSDGILIEQKSNSPFL